MIHIHWHKLVSIENLNYPGGICVTRYKRVCRCGSIKLRVESYE